MWFCVVISENTYPRLVCNLYLLYMGIVSGCPSLSSKRINELTLYFAKVTITRKYRQTKTTPILKCFYDIFLLLFLINPESNSNNCTDLDRGQISYYHNDSPVRMVSVNITGR